MFTMIECCDQDGPLMDEIYEGMDNMLGETKDCPNGYDDFKEIYEIIKDIIIYHKKVGHDACSWICTAPRFYDLSYLAKLAPGEKIKPQTKIKRS